VKLPADFEPAGFAGADASLLCTVKQIRRVTLPELGDEFAKKIGADSLDALREHVKHEVEHQLGRQRERYIEERVLDELIRRSSFDLPERLVERATQEAVAGMQAHLERAGMPEGEARAKAASESERARQEQSRALRVTFLVDRIARNEQLHVTERELENAVRALATAHRVSAQEAFDQLDESGRLGSLRAEILEAKVRKLLRDHAKVFEAKADSPSP
jgi:trigger factor